MERRNRSSVFGGCLTLLLGLAGPALAAGVDGGVTFHDIAQNGGAGIGYHRTPSVTIAVRQALQASSPIPLSVFVTNQGSFTPQKDHGDPGIAVLDYDNDGYLDLYVTNGPGTPNSLYHNLLGKTGILQFEDVGVQAGVDLTAYDNTGVCAGDIDNDGFTDLYVLGVNNWHNTLFHNNGDGTFSNITATAGVAGDLRNASSCTMADFDGDGLLDIFVANTHADWSQRDVVLTPEFYDARIQHNQLFMNHSTFDGNQRGDDFSSHHGGDDDHHSQANIRFADETVARGLTNFEMLNGDPTYTWAAAAVDYDGDGDVDILEADSQGSMSRPFVGLNRIFENDGTGHFKDVSIERGLTAQGSWMGLSFGDYNCDGYLDFFSTNLGSYVGGPTNASRWFLGSATKAFSDPGIPTLANGGIGGSPFGWGTASIDYDNDGDQDIVWFGDEDLVQFLAADNPGTLLRNTGQCSGTFQWDQTAIDRDNRLRQVQGVAFGDFNNDGFVDIVNVASLRIVPVTSPINRFLLYTAILGPMPDVFSSVASLELLYTTLLQPGFLTYIPTTLPDGDLAIEINSANNGNRWAKVDLVGTKNLTRLGRVNRDGAGALVRFTPAGGHTIIRPVTDGESHASTSQREVNVGLGSAATGTVEVDWPVNNHPVKNKLYNLAASEKISFPEIPCSYDVAVSGHGPIPAFLARVNYALCVTEALVELRAGNQINDHNAVRFFNSATKAFDQAHPGLPGSF